MQPAEPLAPKLLSSSARPDREKRPGHPYEGLPEHQLLQSHLLEDSFWPHCLVWRYWLLFRLAVTVAERNSHAGFP